MYLNAIKVPAIVILCSMPNVGKDFFVFRTDVSQESIRSFDGFWQAILRL